jgi:hypothetical protein
MWMHLDGIHAHFLSCLYEGLVGRAPCKMLRWNLGYNKNFSFTTWNFGYHGAFHGFFLPHDGISSTTEPFTNFSFTLCNSRQTRSLRETIFIYITKSIYIGSGLLNVLPLDLGPLFARKRVRSILF